MKLNGLKPVIQKRDEAVSPIIATILLVAITVILASTLYLALGGFFTAKTTSVPSVGLTATNSTIDTRYLNYTITLTSPSSNTISWSTVQFYVTINGVQKVITLQSTTPSFPVTKITAYGSYGTYVNGGQTLTLIIPIASATGPVTTLVMDLTGSGGGQMGTTSL